MTDDERVGILQGMVDGLAGDIEVLQAAVADGRTPEKALRPLAAAMIYVVDRFDLVPDHIEGLGLADDAAVMRLAAKRAVFNGADEPRLRGLAAQAADLGEIFGELTGPLEDYLQRLEWEAPRGKTPLEVVSDPQLRIHLWRELSQRAREHRQKSLVGGVHGDAANVLKLLRKLVKARLQKAGLA